MPSITLKENESLDFAIRRLKRVVEKAGLPKELRKREFYEPPSKIKKRCVSTAKKRMLKKLIRERSFLKKGNKNSRIY
ncbi:30S ribosomal protein S21 [Candidatus Azoamicus ciliaticola]|uniref:Small ribosomal subunit protein bS21 n=1 Tax=Candidatus Azoamicus ciliaticola TaxID=2652803 RepID=A0A6J5JWG5_9GAMM|nr:30S ribosomal protein S21 [Candidatus Azoamicus ciliaticola]CAB3976226.1 30S ribosomal protein S21 [Candidatus Azoamicus ciliaticola]